MQMAERRSDFSLRRQPFGCLNAQVRSAVSISILLAADIVAVRIVAVVVSAIGTVGTRGRGTNRCGSHRRRAVSTTRIIPAPVTVTRATRDAVPTAHATDTNGSTSNASHSGGAAVEASTASVPATTPTARERVIRDKAGSH
jgi:hypothetical protein